MGNWRTVNLSGSCDVKDLKALKDACTVKHDYSGLHCLSIMNGICGLGDWVGDSGSISSDGNLAEIDFTVEDVAEQLIELVEVAPSLNLWCDCGGNYEVLKCVASIKVKDGVVEVLKARVQYIKEMTDKKMEENLMNEMGLKIR